MYHNIDHICIYLNCNNRIYLDFNIYLKKYYLILNYIYRSKLHYTYQFKNSHVELKDTNRSVTNN
jgi:hypothetical protein